MGAGVARAATLGAAARNPLVALVAGVAVVALAVSRAPVGRGETKVLAAAVHVVGRAALVVVGWGRVAYWEARVAAAADEQEAPAEKVDFSAVATAGRAAVVSEAAGWQVGLQEGWAAGGAGEWEAWQVVRWAAATRGAAERGGRRRRVRSRRNCAAAEKWSERITRISIYASCVCVTAC